MPLDPVSVRVAKRQRLASEFLAPWKGHTFAILLLLSALGIIWGMICRNYPLINLDPGGSVTMTFLALLPRLLFLRGYDYSSPTVGPQRLENNVRARIQFGSEISIPPSQFCEGSPSMFHTGLAGGVCHWITAKTSAKEAFQGSLELTLLQVLILRKC